MRYEENNSKVCTLQNIITDYNTYFENVLNHSLFKFVDRCDGKYQARFGLIPFRKTSNNGGSNVISSSSQQQQSPPAELIQRGWLIHETLVQLKLHQPSALNIWKQKHKNKDLYIKVTPLQTSQSGYEFSRRNSRQDSIDMEESIDISETRATRKVWPIVEVAVGSSFFCFKG